MAKTEEKPNAKAMHDPDDFRMSFGDHLEELRKRIIYGMLGVCVVGCFTFYFGMDIVTWLILPLVQAQQRLHIPTGTQAIDPLTPFGVYMKVSIIAALMLGAPWLLYQLWKFIEAGLYQTERRVVHVLAPFSAVMVILGIAFMYYAMLPISISFLLMFSQQYPGAGDAQDTMMGKLQTAIYGSADQPDEDKPLDKQPEVTVEEFNVPALHDDPKEPTAGQMWINSREGTLKLHYRGHTRMVWSMASESFMKPVIEINEYISFVLYMALGIVVGFQLPVIMLVGGWTGILPPSFVTKYRKHSIFVCALLGALLTPSDPLSMMILAVPLYGLYELGVLLIKMTYKPRGLLWDDPLPEDKDK